MDILPFHPRGPKVRRPTQQQVSEGRRLLAALDAAEASGLPSRIKRAGDAVRLHVERIRPELAKLVAAGYGPVDRQGQSLYVVCPRCGRLLEQHVHDRDGVRISTAPDTEPCVKCIERGIFDSVPRQP